ncbi:helix-turn-helix domain-containing protein [Sinorhizobium medicae]|nr:helix-turn-helix domain-containing protein [Sinorhizobium medicae]
MNNTKTTCAIDVVIGSNIRRVRELAGVSRRGLAKAVGVSWSQLKKCEDGQRRISAGSIVAVARALNCDLDEFWKDIDVVAPLLFSPVPSAEAMTVAQNFDRIRSPAKREEIAKLIATFAEAGALKPAAE